MNYIAQGVLDSSEHFFLRTSAFAMDHLYHPLSIGSFQVDTSYQVTRLSYSKYLLLYMQKGRLSCQSESMVGTVSAGQVLLINCAKPHVYFALSDASFLFLHFDGAQSSDIFKLITEKQGMIISVTDPQAYENAFPRLFSMIHGDHMRSETKASAEIYDLLMLLVSDVAAQKMDSARRNVVERAIAYIGTHLSEELSLASLAEHFNYSEGYFSKIFKQYVGMTPHQFILHNRIDFARHLLSNTTMTVQEVAERCGFHDASGFCYAFCQICGTTPLDFRKHPL